MNQDMKLTLELAITGDGKVAAAIKGMENVTSQATHKMASSWATVDSRLSSVRTSLVKIGALLGGGALLRQAILDVTEFERGLTEMRLTGGLTAKETENIRNKIIALSSTSLQLPEEQLATFKDMVAAGIDPKKIMGGLDAINRTATAAFANVEDIGRAAVDLFQKMDIKPEKLERAFNIMHQAGKEGRFELRDMSRYFPEVLAAASQYGIKDEKGVAQIAAMLQIARRNRGEPAEAATDMKAFFGHMITYRKQFQKAGFNVFDYVDLNTGKFKPGKDIDKFFIDLKARTKGGSQAYLKAIGIQDYEATNFMAGLMKDWKDYEEIRDKSLQAADKNIVGKDFNEVQKTSYAKLKKLEIERSKAMKSAGSSNAAEKAFSLENWAIEHPGTTGAGALTSYLSYKALQRYALSKFPDLSSRLLSSSVAAIPAVGAGLVGWSSIELGKLQAEVEARHSSTRRLLELRNRQIVMGGGPDTYQVKAIDEELAKRGFTAGRGSGAEDIVNNITIGINIDSTGNILTRTNDLNTRINTIPRGGFFAPLPSH
jgi:TP901 family phage tail tape measure protein